jgi:DNA-binding response OmpR family regulator
VDTKILVVEDDGDLRYLYTASLALAGYDATSVDDGVDALVRIEQDPPDLLVLDLGLKTLGGESVAQELSAHASTKRIPIVVVTGQRIVPGDIRADCVLTKPVDIDDLLRTVRRCLGQRPASPMVAAAAAARPSRRRGRGRART